jgi:hypothetical protein
VAAKNFGQRYLGGSSKIWEQEERNKEAEIQSRKPLTSGFCGGFAGTGIETLPKEEPYQMRA